MADSTLDLIVARRKQLLAEVDELDAAIAVIRRVQKVAGKLAERTEEPSAPTTLARTPRRSRRAGSPREDILKQAEEILLRRKNRPIRAGALLKQLEKDEFEIGGQRPVGNLSAMLSHSKRFESLGRTEGWILVDYKTESNRASDMTIVPQALPTERQEQ